MGNHCTVLLNFLKIIFIIKVVKNVEWNKIGKMLIITEARWWE